MTTVVGSGIAAQRLSADVGLRLLENSTATVFGLAVLILLLGPVSGAHFNPPVVSATDALLGPRTGTGLPVRDLVVYMAAQVLGGIGGGAVLANLMFQVPTAIATTERSRRGGRCWARSSRPRAWCY